MGRTFPAHSRPFNYTPCLYLFILFISAVLHPSSSFRSTTSRLRLTVPFFHNSLCSSYIGRSNNACAGSPWCAVAANYTAYHRHNQPTFASVRHFVFWQDHRASVVSYKTHFATSRQSPLPLLAVQLGLFQKLLIGHKILSFFSATIVQNINCCYKYTALILCDNCRLTLSVGYFIVLHSALSRPPTRAAEKRREVRSVSYQIKYAACT